MLQIAVSKINALANVKAIADKLVQPGDPPLLSETEFNGSSVIGNDISLLLDPDPGPVTTD